MPSVPDTVRDRVAYLELIEIDDRAEGLTQWEIDFVEDMRVHLLLGLSPTEKQQRIIDRIREEKIG